MTLEASGQSPVQDNTQLSCWEAAMISEPASPEAFTADLAARIAEQFVIRRDFVNIVLAEARYTELIERVLGAPTTKSPPPDGSPVPPDGSPVPPDGPPVPGESGDPQDDYQPMAADPEADV